MYGAILGDIIGSPYEFDRGNKSKDFPPCGIRPVNRPRSDHGFS